MAKSKLDGWLISTELATCRAFWQQLPSHLDRLVFLACIPHLDENGCLPMDAGIINELAFPLMGNEFKFVTPVALERFARTKPPLVVIKDNLVRFVDFKRINANLIEKKEAVKKAKEESEQKKLFYFLVCGDFIDCKGMVIDDPREVWPYVRRYGRALRDLWEQAGGSADTTISVVRQAKKEYDAKFPDWGLEAVSNNYLTLLKKAMGGGK